MTRSHGAQRWALTHSGGWEVVKCFQEYVTFEMGLERGVCQVEGVTGRKEVEDGILDSGVDGGLGGQQEHGVLVGLHEDCCGRTSEGLGRGGWG